MSCPVRFLSHQRKRSLLAGMRCHRVLVPSVGIDLDLEGQVVV